MSKFETPTTTISIQNFPLDGYLLDAGGGGEGIIGRLKGRVVVSIDPSSEELEEAENDSLEIVMDVRDLDFLDEQFDAVTAFYTTMYIKNEDRNKAFSEMFRVLKPGGHLYIRARNTASS